jgi:hypothetical protein
MKTNIFDLTELLQLRAAIDKALSEEGVIIRGKSPSITLDKITL